MDVRHIIAVSVPIVIVSLALFFRRSWLLRYASVAVLAFLSLLHATYLIAGHRLIAERLPADAGGQAWPEGTVDRGEVLSLVQQSNHGEIPLYGAVVGTLVFLALLPVRGDTPVCDSPRPS